jgi:hypothetical protein
VAVGVMSWARIPWGGGGGGGAVGVEARRGGGGVRACVCAWRFGCYCGSNCLGTGVQHSKTRSFSMSRTAQKR